MQLNPVMDKFYTGILNYAGIELKDNIFINKNDKLGDITIDGRHLTLPYFDNLKRPENKLIFHPLNENYTSPENSVFNLYKKRLILELNLKISSTIISLISVGSDVQLQQKIKSSKLINLISSLGEMDHTLIDNFLQLVKVSKKQNEEAFILDIFLKKNGELKDVPYAAIGKVNFHLYNEVIKSLEDKEREYKVYGAKLRKKDLLAFETIFNVIFPSIDNKEMYAEGTDNKIFRYLNILLKTSYIITHRLNEIADMLDELNEPTLCVDDIKSDLSWVTEMEKLYEMGTEIRLIPNQLDIAVEAGKLKLDESKAAIAQQEAPRTPVYEPNRVQEVIQQPQQPMMTQQPIQQPQQLSPEDIIRGAVGMPGGMMQPMQQPMMMGNMQPMQQQPLMPMWMQQELMKSGQPQIPQQPMQPMMMGNMQPMQQPMMMQQPVMYPNMQQQPMMMQPMMMQQPQGLQVNPHFMNRVQGPWS